MTSNEIREKKFNKALGFGYRTDEVDRYMDLISQAFEDMIEENDSLSKKLEVLADKINDYRNDEESLRTALLGAQKLGDSVIRDSKNKAAGIMRDANQKAEMMVDNAKRQVEREEKVFENLKKEIEKFKNTLFDMYKQHLAIVSNMPGEIKEITTTEKPQIENNEKQSAQQQTSTPLQMPAPPPPPVAPEEAPTPPEEPAQKSPFDGWGLGGLEEDDEFNFESITKRLSNNMDTYAYPKNNNTDTNLKFGSSVDKK